MASLDSHGVLDRVAVTKPPPVLWDIDSDPSSSASK